MSECEKRNESQVIFVCMRTRETGSTFVLESFAYIQIFFLLFLLRGGVIMSPPPPHPSPPTHTPVCNTVVLTLPGIAPPNETSVFVFILSSCVSENIQHGEKLYRKDRMRKREESWKRRNRKNTSLNFSDSFFFQSALKFKWAIPWKSKAQTGVEALWC